MSVGESAREHSRGLATRTERLRAPRGHGANGTDPADSAFPVSSEAPLAAAMAPLEARGWRLLAGRAISGGGNIDLIAVGPSGVAVIDTKEWAGRLRVIGTDLTAGGYRRTTALDGVIRQLVHVNGALGELASTVPTRGVLALCGTNRRFVPEAVRGVWLAGVETLPALFAGGSGRMDTALVDTVYERLRLTLPPKSTVLRPVDISEVSTFFEDPRPLRKPVSPVFESAHRYFYLRRRRHDEGDRVTLMDRDGTDLAWKDTTSGEIALVCAGDVAHFSTAVMAGTTPTRVNVGAADLPRVTAPVLSGHTHGAIAQRHVTAVIGQEWRRGTAHRMYGTLVDPEKGTFPLGHVDIVAGAYHPSEAGFPRALGTAGGHLRMLFERRPDGALG